ncbi:uncharacterized protein J3R85_020369 [Psidium guajava]|nr:uncharacterized protein J3R85_020369 [Psidium guajava]
MNSLREAINNDTVRVPKDPGRRSSQGVAEPRGADIQFQRVRRGGSPLSRLRLDWVYDLGKPSSFSLSRFATGHQRTELWTTHLCKR